MAIEIDIELELGQLEIDMINHIKSTLPERYLLECRGKDSYMYVVLDDGKMKSWSLDVGIISFLSKLGGLEKEIRAVDASLRIGIFYSVAETIVCPAFISAKAIRSISIFSLSVDITGYPSIEDEDC